MADRKVHGLRIARVGQQGNRRAVVVDGQEKDPGAQRGATVWHRHRGAKGVAERRPATGRGRCMSTAHAVQARPGCVAKGESGRVGEVWSRLETVDDPELDEAVTELGFVTAVEVEGGGVSIGFRLPTYWCAANFAYLMADDMRRAIAALPWVTTITITLDEHMYAAEINRGVAAGRSFQQTFGSEANGEVEDVRRIFLVKAFQRRQEALLTWLLAQGCEPAMLVRLSMTQLSALAGESTDDEKTR